MKYDYLLSLLFLLPASLHAQGTMESLDNIYQVKKGDTAYSIASSHGISLEDLISIGAIGLIKAVNTYRCDKNTKLATYSSRCIENEILMYLRRTSNSRTEISIDEPLSTDGEGGELSLSDVLGTEPDSVSRPLEDLTDREILRASLENLSSRERQIISMRYGLDGSDGLTQKEVAEKLGISQSYISRLEKRIITRLRKDMQKVM